MISLLFKHYIGEWCINHVFDSIKHNFSDTSPIAVGNTFREIVITTGPLIAHHKNCVITDVYSGTYLGKETTLFNFTDSTGDRIYCCDFFSVKLNR